MAWKVFRRARAVRIVVSVGALVAVTAAIAMGCGSWLLRMQIVPALLACSGIWLAVWVAVTALVGRIYCSSVCPLGTLQDIFAALTRRLRPQGYFYRPARPALRWCMVVALAAAAVFGQSVVVGLLDPYSDYARIVNYLLMPAVRPVTFTLAGLLVAFLTLAVTAFFSIRGGRTLCNTVCPVGTLLGALSRYSLYHVDIDTDKCVGCGLCTARCKAHCIDPGAHTVDLSRCVVCFDCLSDCPNSAITFRRGRHRLKMPMLQTVEGAQSACSETPGKAAGAVSPISRRTFLAAMAATGAALPAAALPGDTRPLNAAIPPGNEGTEAFHARCTACGSCVSVCPTGVIRPSLGELGWRNLMQPVLDFNIAACRYDCTKCSEACPTGALLPLTVAAKHRFVIGKARLVTEDCLLYTTGRGNGKCAAVCPRQAIVIETLEDGRRLPRVDFDECIGCGECRRVCPARPRAWVIEGV